ncbi:MAG: FIST N-terminal domain-containing protein [Gammaproteobacteria bacterium]
MNAPFLLGVATGPEPRKLVNDCLLQLGNVRGKYQLGFIYANDSLGEDLEAILGRLKQETGIVHWLGTLGLGVCSTGAESYEEPTLVVMLADIDAKHFSIIGSNEVSEEKLLEEISSYCKDELPHVGIIHGDPSNPATPNIIEKISETVPAAYLVGGLTSSNFENFQVANEIIQGSVSGIFFSPEINTVIGHTQGCTPLDQKHVITKAERNLLIELDGRPALDVLREDIGEVLAKDLNKITGYIFAGLPVEQSDTADYLVRNIIGFDKEEKIIAVGDYIYEGGKFMFCRRDGNSARADMLKMLATMKSRLQGPPRGGLYYNCLGRGRYQFGDNSEELKMIKQELGNFPLAGFFANGEIFHNRLYGYTGVLVLFN